MIAFLAPETSISDPLQGLFMPMTPAGNQINLRNQKLAFFTSQQPHCDTCMILSHGRLLFGDGTYNLPPNVTLAFYVQHGATRRSNARRIVMGPAGGGAPVAQATGPVAIPNYTLRKAAGSGLPAEYLTYSEIQNVMQDNYDRANAWSPHVVSVRRRMQGLGKTIQIGQVIDAVIAHDPAITKFHFGGCRADASDQPFISALIRAAVAVFK